MTPSRIGRTAVMWPGVRPSMSRASSPTATMRGVPFGVAPSPSCAIATTEGSVRTIPLPRTYTMTFAVPRSMPTCFANTRTDDTSVDLDAMVDDVYIAAGFDELEDASQRALGGDALA